MKRFKIVGEVVPVDEDADSIDVQSLVEMGGIDGGDLKAESLKVTEIRYVEPRQDRVALARDILVVAKPGTIGDWAAYIGVVPGVNHDVEEDMVTAHGTKVRKSLAVELFPFDPDKYRE